MNISLRQLSISDADKIAKWKSDPVLSALILSTSGPVTLSQAIEWIEKNSADANQRLNGILLSDGEKAELVGITRLMFIDFDAKVGEFGIYLGEQTKRGLGIGSQALRLTIKQAFESLVLNKIFLKVNATNANAIGLYTKYNFVIEGVLREHFYNRDNLRFDDIIYMALFNDDNK